MDFAKSFSRDVRFDQYGVQKADAYSKHAKYIRQIGKIKEKWQYIYE